MKFFYYDLIFLVAFCLFLFFFLRARKKKLQREGIIFLYRTKVGLKFVNNAAKKLKKILPATGTVSIILGFLMMALIFYFLIKTIFLTAQIPLSAPPLLPLVPYAPQAFKLPLPPFYFIYWILIIIVVAITHEFAHGVFARHNKVRVKSTGFGFLGPFLAAFVEPDEKQLSKKKKKAQQEIFAAGSFSNLIFAIIFMLALQLFFVLAYQPSGLAFTFASSAINISEIKNIGNYTPEEFFNLSDKELVNINKTLTVKTENKTYYLDEKLIKQIPNVRKIIRKYNKIVVYEDAPAFRAALAGGIKKIGEYEINKIEDVFRVLENYKPGDEIIITTSESAYKVVLEKNPNNESRAYLGIAFSPIKGASKIFSSITSPFFSMHVYAKPKGNEQTTTFFRDLLIWLVLICFFVAIFNMLPVSFLDGGKMFFVLFLTITKSKNKARTITNLASYIVLLILLIMMFVWLAG